MLNNVSFMGKLPVNNLGRNAIEKIAAEAGYTSPTAPISNEIVTKSKEEIMQVSKEAAEAIKLTRSPINIKKPEAIPADVIKSYEASIGK